MLCHVGSRVGAESDGAGQVVQPVKLNGDKCSGTDSYDELSCEVRLVARSYASSPRNRNAIRSLARSVVLDL